MASDLPILTPARRNTLSEDVAGQLVAAICRLELRGGERLVEADLAARFRVSRTPVRDALGELAAAGLVDLAAGRSVVVREFGPKALRDIYHVRATLEAEAARSATGRAGAPALRDARAAMRSLLDVPPSGRDANWERSAMDADEAFHLVIAGGSGNPRLAEEIGRYAKQVRAVRQAVKNPAGEQEMAIGEHLAVLDALLAGHADAAGAAMRRHIESAAAVALGMMFPGRGAAE